MKLRTILAGLLLAAALAGCDSTGTPAQPSATPPAATTDVPQTGPGSPGYPTPVPVPTVDPYATPSP